MENGFISIDRKILDWQWFTHPHTRDLFIILLLTVNWEDRKWHGMEIKRGQRIVSYQKLANELCISPSQVRGAMDNLKSTGEVTYKWYNKFGLVTVTKYNEYQTSNRQKHRQDTGRAPASNNNITSKQEEQYNNSIDNSPSENERAQEPDEPKKEKLSLSDSFVAPPVPGAPPLQYGNEEINSMLLALKGKIGIDSFADGQKWERIYGKHCVTLLHKLGKNEFVRRLESLLEDSFHQKNCNRIKYVYNQIQGFIEPKPLKGKTVFIP